MKEALSAGGVLLLISYALALLNSSSGIAQACFALGMVLIVFGLYMHFSKKEKLGQPMSTAGRRKTGAINETV